MNLDKAEKEFRSVLDAPDDEFGEDEWNLGAGLASTGMKLVEKLRRIKKIVENVDGSARDAIEEIKDLLN